MKQNKVATKELIHKHSLGVTLAPIIICHKKSLITDDQLQAAMYLRYLYLWRNGKLCKITSNLEEICIKAGLHMHFRKKEMSEETEMLYSKLYTQLVNCLKKEKIFNSLCDICIFDTPPFFLRPHQGKIEHLDKAFIQYKQFRDAIKSLTKHVLKLQNAREIV